MQGTAIAGGRNCLPEGRTEAKLRIWISTHVDSRGTQSLELWGAGVWRSVARRGFVRGSGRKFLLESWNAEAWKLLWWESGAFCAWEFLWLGTGQREPLMDNRQGDGKPS